MMNDLLRLLCPFLSLDRYLPIVIVLTRRRSAIHRLAPLEAALRRIPIRTLLIYDPTFVHTLTTAETAETATRTVEDVPAPALALAPVLGTEIIGIAGIETEEEEMIGIAEMEETMAATPAAAGMIDTNRQAAARLFLPTVSPRQPLRPSPPPRRSQTMWWVSLG